MVSSSCATAFRTRKSVLAGLRRSHVASAEGRLAEAARPRVLCVVLFLLTLVLGLASRQFGASLPAFVAEYAGDVLWASLVFWLLAFIRPSAASVALAAGAVAISLTVELSQLYHAPWLDALRARRLGALVLGQGFLWSDLACYLIGAALAAAIDGGIRRARVRPAS